jgi:hypothetical protein
MRNDYNGNVVKGIWLKESVLFARRSPIGHDFAHRRLKV